MGSPDQPEDIDALKMEVEELRERNRTLEHESSTHSGHTGWGARARSTGVVLALVLGTLCMTLSPLAIWGRNLVLNTDRYVQTMSPLSSDPGVQQLVVKAVDKQVEDNVDISSLVEQSLPPRAAPLAGPLESAFQGLVNTVVTRFVASDAFHQLWLTINRVAHAQVVYLLTGHVSGGVGAVSLDNSGRVLLNLSAVVTAVKQQLVAAGLTVASNIPVVGATITIAQVKGLAQARKWVRILNDVADILPWLGLAFFAAAIALAHRRRRTLIAASFCTAGAMAFIGLGLFIGRHIYLNRIDPTVIPRDTAQFLFDTVVRYLRDGIRLVALVALLVALIAWFTGPSQRMVDLRARLLERWRTVITAAGEGAVGAFVVAHTTALRITVGVLVLLILITASSPSLAGFIVLVVIGALLILLIEAVRVSALKAGHSSHKSSSSPAS
ncbi:MAG TPA: hypothetical protein VMH41_01400 [Mycobacteriales bacterium]|nr:hypothetical protein [Mycobacteriales bacterium]